MLLFSKTHSQFCYKINNSFLFFPSLHVAPEVHLLIVICIKQRGKNIFFVIVYITTSQNVSVTYGYCMKKRKLDLSKNANKSRIKTFIIKTRLYLNF